MSPGSRVPVLCVFCPLSLVLGRMFRLLDYGSTLSGVTASGQGATGPPGCPWGHPAHAVAPVALEQYLMGGLCRAMGPCRLSRPPDPGKPWQWQVTPLIHGRCCGGPPQPENAIGRGPPNRWVPVAEVPVPVAEVKGPPREGSLHFEPWQQGSCPLCLLPSVPCARSDVQITGLWINTFRSYGKWTGCHWPTWLPVGAPGTCCGSSGSGTISDGRAVPRHGTMPIVEATRPGQAVAVAGNPTDPWPVLRGSPAARECRWSRPPPNQWVPAGVGQA